MASATAVTALLSALLDNVTTVLIVAPVTILITSELNIKAYPFLFAEIIASNIVNQEVKDLRDEQAEALEQRKRDLYKALGAVAGMDVEEIDRRGRETRAAEAAERQAEQDALMGRAPASSGSEDAATAASDDPSESAAP